MVDCLAEDELRTYWSASQAARKGDHDGAETLELIALHSDQPRLRDAARRAFAAHRCREGLRCALSE